ncbi:MAG: hypothetical protein HC837_19515 [Chloroflexaceae bacterium]|nr:hypothetical protein [Chloroflexaceae bacterium]
MTIAVGRSTLTPLHPIRAYGLAGIPAAAPHPRPFSHKGRRESLLPDLPWPHGLDDEFGRSTLTPLQPHLRHSLGTAASRVSGLAGIPAGHSAVVPPPPLTPGPFQG